MDFVQCTEKRGGISHDDLEFSVFDLVCNMFFSWKVLE